MKKILLFIALALSLQYIQAQALYFPPTGSAAWDTLSPAALGWCQPRIDTLYSYLQQKNTCAFMVLKDGKIVLERYFGTFTVDSIHTWNSAGKSITATLAGMVQERGLINIDSPATHYLGPGWTSATPAQEDSITLLHLLTMTSGLNPLPVGCTNEDTSAACLTYLVPAGTQWSYHTGAYRKLQSVMSDAAGVSYDVVTNNLIGTTTGMTGLWVQQTFYSTPRTAARFGLLTLNHDIWGMDTLLRDTAYYRAMTNTSQPYNLSYGYLWWLNGKASYMLPGSQSVNTGSLVPNAPADMFCALGKDDQKVYVVPSADMVVVRMGNAADSSTDASSAFDNELWGYIDQLDSCSAATGIAAPAYHPLINIYPNPVQDVLYFQTSASLPGYKITINDVLGKILLQTPCAAEVNIAGLTTGIYLVKVSDEQGDVIKIARLIKQ